MEKITGENRQEKWGAMCDRCIAVIHGSDPVNVMLRASFEYSKTTPFDLASEEQGVEVCRGEVEYMIAALAAAGFVIVPGHD